MLAGDAMDIRRITGRAGNMRLPVMRWILSGSPEGRRMRLPVMRYPPDGGRKGETDMGKLKLEQFVVGQVQTNCYFAIHEETKEMLIIDPGDGAGKLAQKIKQAGYLPQAILLTHGHFDHAAGAQELAETFGISIYICEAEKETLEDERLNAGWMVGMHQAFHADVFLKDEQELDLAGFHIRVLLTPGHTAGGCCYYLPYENVLFSGDTLFSMSVGRTDLGGGSMSRLVRSIREKLIDLPEQTDVYPGHGEATTIGRERMYNPYL